MTKTDIIIALVFIACCIICYAKGIRDGKADARYEAELKKPRRARKFVVVSARSAICPKPELAHSQWEFSPKELG